MLNVSCNVLKTLTESWKAVWLSGYRRLHVGCLPLSLCGWLGAHPLSSPSPPALNLSQHQCLFKWVFSSVVSCVRLFETPWIAACQASLSITNSRSSLKLRSIESVLCLNDQISCIVLYLQCIVYLILIIYSITIWPTPWAIFVNAVCLEIVYDCLLLLYHFVQLIKLLNYFAQNLYSLTGFCLANLSMTERMA